MDQIRKYPINSKYFVWTFIYTSLEQWELFASKK